MIQIEMLHQLIAWGSLYLDAIHKFVSLKMLIAFFFIRINENNY